MLKRLAFAGFFALSAPAAAQEAYGPELPQVAPLVQSPADTKAARERENWNAVKPALIAWQAVQLLDMVTTIQCGSSPHCYEGNAEWLYGRKPKAERVIPIKLAVMAGGYLLTREVSKRSKTAAFAFLVSSGVPTAMMVKGNIRILW